MQGRLLPPIDNQIQAFPREKWSEEFANAAECGLDGIEWIHDLFGLDANPLATVEGIEQMKSLSAEYKITVRSVCADYFMDFPLVRANVAEFNERLRHLEWLLGQCRLARITRLVLPFVDRSAIKDETDTQMVLKALRHVLPLAEANGVELHLETSLPPAQFASLLEQVPHDLVRVNYDSGNSASLGFHPRDEFAVYGKRVGSVHIKDRKRGGGTVPLGTGDADFAVLFDCLKSVRYQGDFVLQVARRVTGNEIEWARQNREFVLRMLRSWN